MIYSNTVIIGCILIAAFGISLNNAAPVEEDACYTPAVTSDILTTTFFSAGFELNLFPLPVCNRDTVIIKLNCSGNGADVSKVAIAGLQMANVTFNYYSGDLLAYTDKLMGSQLGALQQNVFTSKQDVSDVTHIELKFDPLPLFGLPSPCFIVNILDVNACCEGTTGCAPGISGVHCDSFYDFIAAQDAFNNQFPGVGSFNTALLLAYNDQVNQVTQALQERFTGLASLNQAIVQASQLAVFQAQEALQGIIDQQG